LSDLGASLNTPPIGRDRKVVSESKILFFFIHWAIPSKLNRAKSFATKQLRIDLFGGQKFKNL
jgi:hypothetical protein